jgi:hypothetical protein
VRNLKSKIVVLLMTGAATVTLAPSASAAPLPNFAVGIQLADKGGASELGTEQLTKFANFGSSASLFAGDANNFDPDVARINLKPAFGGGLLNSNLDFRVGGRARDGGAELGAVVFTDWASAGGGVSDVVTDANSFDPDQYQVFLETRPLPPGAGFTDFRLFLIMTDAGEGDGFPAFTGWASLGGGQSAFARDRNGFDPDGFRIGLEVV